MFNTIAGRYDFLNRLLSFGFDVNWRHQAIQFLRKKRPAQILDIATGTGDFAIKANSLKPEKIIGIDISEEMLKIGRDKILKKKLEGIIELQLGDAENLHFPDHSFDAATVAFGVRNFEDLQKGISEIYRVLKPGGAFVVLEFSKPDEFPEKQVYQLYTGILMPFIGKLFSKDKSAYKYLPESVKAFKEGKEFLAVMQEAGFTNLAMKRMTFGVVSIYYGEK
ncbi:MAG: bifunctional demethylmenaquinone methyltransferase/2-methoxy-6-polyprenyl-1,4-benzoquinol methylase [Bacteroidetes bacterium GWF2_38_335]|nr:MAG: bifunctional demethylmenaquinone methyltransferase/2-methoxy-6-polyprenyl-1,4-benzoquinol methylase [Bacteroidetes bacterium GWF2_38_335]OFY81807.1 MAG: bifunctional demethylmenaquinone methyltransferase/2-methoxy-6-polyprenyl-1,4-benzoquinol methylase [Bacteroidetes bacterium RIFOXYA12_FULL_38_20]HBS87879.1 bifunctional demethylmenaquinone methyltransferase/2-methoxy-6-polyprenyl-1,4-benzoquinol methylase UbiE [Bacteroidales bacterium]